MVSSPLTRRSRRQHAPKVDEHETMNIVGDTPRKTPLSPRRQLLNFSRLFNLRFSSASSLFQVIRAVIVLLVVLIIFPLYTRKVEHYGVIVPNLTKWNKNIHSKPRIVFYESQLWPHDHVFSSYEPDPMLAVNQGEETIPQPDQDDKETNCIPMTVWQTQKFPTCNTVHEIALKSSGHQSSIDLSRIASKYVSDFMDPKLSEKSVEYSDDNAMIIGKGWFRHSWLLTSLTEKTIFKTLRLERDFVSELYEWHRIDAVAMERLTKSPYIIDIYSYCGQTAINEYAHFDSDMTEFRHFTNTIRSMKKSKKINMMKLKVGAMLALGLQHIHEVDGINNTTLMHYDINPSNVMITEGGIPKFNDFNVAHFFYWDQVNNRRCPYVGHLKTPLWRSPEEMQETGFIDEKADVYSLCNLLHQLVGGHSPRGKVKNVERLEQIRADIKNGIAPVLPTKFTSSDEPEIVSLVEAINSCYRPNPQERSSAREIASHLQNTLLSLQSTERDER